MQCQQKDILKWLTSKNKIKLIKCKEERIELENL